MSRPGFSASVDPGLSQVSFVPRAWSPLRLAPRKLRFPVSVRWVATYTGSFVNGTEMGLVLLRFEERRLVLLDLEGIAIDARLLL